jgi:hypothetical protein
MYEIKKHREWMDHNRWNGYSEYDCFTGQKSHHNRLVGWRVREDIWQWLQSEAPGFQLVRMFDYLIHPEYRTIIAIDFLSLETHTLFRLTFLNS